MVWRMRFAFGASILHPAGTPGAQRRITVTIFAAAVALSECSATSEKKNKILRLTDSITAPFAEPPGKGVPSHFYSGTP